MKISIGVVLVIISFAGLMISCKKDEEAVDKTCRIAFILNLTNAAGDTTFIDGIAGEPVRNAPVPARAGFTFKGWYANSADANPDPTKNTAAPKFPAYDFSVKPVYLNMILYARWVK